MQNLQVEASLAGARGWPWRVERIEMFGGPAEPRLLHLSRPQAGGAGTFVAVRPQEPIAVIDARAGLLPMPAREAAEIVAGARTTARTAFALGSAARLRGDIHHWQLCAALAFERGHARVLVADEAGMGKTVSAALAIAECLDGASDRRCLVLAPAHLLPQWRAELRDRMQIDPIVLDAASLQRLQHEVPAGVPAWSLPGCLLTSIDFCKQPHILRSLETAVWDLLVVDEAHLACGASERHAAVDLIARRSRRVLLLTATPSDGGTERLRALLALGAGQDAAPVWLRHVAAGRTRAERTLLIAPGAAGRASTAALAAYTRWIASGRRQDAPVALLCSVLVKRALSSAHALHLSLARRHALLGQAPAAAQPSLFDAEDDSGVLGTATGLPVDRERRRLEDLIELSAHAARDDRRLRALVRLVRRAREPVVIFSCFRDTASRLAAALSPHSRVRLIHGALPQAAIDAALEAFAGGDADVLVATDVASQGLNLHHRCRWVVHYDLPWRPPAIPQRTGRVDRLGQTRAVHATFLLDRGALSSDMRERLTSLASRMQEDERPGSRRWGLLAEAEARRLTELRDTAARPSRALRRGGCITVVEIDCVDISGVSVDRRVVALDTEAGPALEWASAFAARLEARLRRALAARGSRRIARERAVLGAALATVGAVVRQDGLFERRADRGRAADAAARAQLEAASRDAIERHVSESRIAAARTRAIASFAIGRPAGR